VQVEQKTKSEAEGKRDRPRVIDWVFTIPFLLAFGLVLLVFDPLQRLARLFGQRPQEIVAGVLQAALIQTFKLSGMRLEVERSPEVKPHTPYVIISNHQSMFDVPIFGGLLFTNYPKYVSKRSLGRGIPSISYNLRRGGNALIDRDDRGQAQAEIRALGERAEQRGVSVVIYPEGTRSRDGQLRPFKPGGTLTLLKAAPRLAVVPAAIDGSWKLLRYNLLPVPFGVVVRVRFSDPILRLPEEDASVLLERAQAEISATLERWRSAGQRN
jgi:1-acyl-sn-glycerol-3-phosphate acyltransferase